MLSKPWHWCFGFAAIAAICFDTSAAAIRANESEAIAQVRSEEPRSHEKQESEDVETGGDNKSGENLTEEELRELKETFEQLASSSFQTRETATSRLTKFDYRALALLKQWQSEAKTAEVMARSQLVIDHIERTGFLARIEVFMRAPGNIEEHKFYGWNSFSHVLGKSRMARQLFVSLLDRHARLCNEEIVGEKLTAYQEEFVKLLKGDIENFNETSVADAVVAQYLMIQLQDKSSADLESISERLTSTAPYSSELNMAPTKTLKRLTGRWVISIQRDPYRALIVALDHSLPEGAILARRTLESGDTGEQNFGLCMETFMVQGKTDDLSLIESFFGDTRTAMKESLLNPSGQTNTVVQEYRDLALAVAIRIRGYTMTDYFPSALSHHLRGINSETLLFLGPDPQVARKAAFERYAAAVAAEKNSAN